jgi:hypothetical protein
MMALPQTTSRASASLITGSKFRQRSDDRDRRSEPSKDPRGGHIGDCGRILQGCFSRFGVVEGIVSRKRPVGLIAFVVTLLVSGIDAGIPNTARADDCLTAPNSLAPQGTRWYYHVDRTNQRKCWYVRATSQPAQQAAAQATSEAAPTAQSHSTPMSSGPMPATAAASAPMSISPGNSAPRLPHVRILVVKPKLAAAVSATTDKSVQGGGQEGSTGPSIPEPPAPKASTLRANAQAAGPPPAAPAAWPATVGAPEPGAVLADAGAESVGPKTDTQVPDRIESTARGGEPTINAGMAGSLTATPMLLTLALGLVAAGTVTRVVMKNAATRRAIAVFDHAESDWVDDQWQPERRNGQEHGFVDEPQESESVTSAASNYESLHPIRAGDEWPEHSLGEGCAFQINEITKREDTLAQLSRDLRKALFVGGCGPRNKTARA